MKTVDYFTPRKSDGYFPVYTYTCVYRSYIPNMHVETMSCVAVLTFQVNPVLDDEAGKKNKHWSHTTLLTVEVIITASSEHITRFIGSNFLRLSYAHKEPIMPRIATNQHNAFTGLEEAFCGSPVTKVASSPKTGTSQSANRGNSNWSNTPRMAWIWAF
jgi:hypothetical protein